ncbi:MarR family winged helix-turn-helix transcriptional regulator [Daejeonella sp.]|uniref:MarR family winged helix-turn-helix transcriptional regulator n=1 Tax=Daejeonella sp. TaxID=2805397 RepID=UPI00398347C5
MKSYQLIHQLVSLLERLEQENPGKELSLTDFSGFLLNHIIDQETTKMGSDVRFGSKESQSQELAYQLDNSIGRLFVYMSRYAKSYIRKALDGTAIHSAEEFTALAILLTHDRLTKSELISYNLQEKTSGTEVIRRLIAAGLVDQNENLNDKRSKSVMITPLGREILFEIFVDMNSVGKIITGDLSVAEKLTLYQLLQKLENFHLDHFRKKTISTKADLLNFAD